MKRERDVSVTKMKMSFKYFVYGWAIIALLLVWMLIDSHSANAQVLYPDFPDALVCNNTLLQVPDPFYEVFWLETIDPVAQIVTYYSNGGVDQYFDMSTGNWSGGDSDYDCATMSIGDLRLTGQAKDFGYVSSTTVAVAMDEVTIYDPIAQVYNGIMIFLMLFFGLIYYFKRKNV